jgi:hypothetical protein
VGPATAIERCGIDGAWREFEGGSLLLGYRYLFVDYDTGSVSLEFDAKLFGRRPRRGLPVLIGESASVKALATA